MYFLNYCLTLWGKKQFKFSSTVASKRALPAYKNMLTLTHFMPLVSFYPLKSSEKPEKFLIFSGGKERDQWHDMGQAIKAPEQYFDFV